MTHFAILTDERVIRHECRDEREFVNGLLMMHKCGRSSKTVLWAGASTPEDLEAIIATGKWERGIPVESRWNNA